LPSADDDDDGMSLAARLLFDSFCCSIILITLSYIASLPSHEIRSSSSLIEAVATMVNKEIIDKKGVKSVLFVSVCYNLPTQKIKTTRTWKLEAGGFYQVAP